MTHPQLIPGVKGFLCIHGARANGRRTGAYNSWRAMKARCGLHGTLYAALSFDPRWALFEAFIHDMGERPAGYELDRIDPSRGYYPDNCRWLPRAENRRRVRR